MRKGFEMVWALHQASGFGKYFLNGDFVGWEEGLKAYWDQQGQRGEDFRSSLYNVSLKFIKDLGPLSDVEIVKEFRTEKGVKEIAAMAKTTAQLLIVHENLKTLIEAFEPGLHQFWPMKISMPCGKVFPEPYFGLRIGQFIESFRPDQSDAACFQQRASIFLSSDTKANTAGLALSQQAIGDAHLWREKKLVKPNIFISDALQAKAVDLGLQLPKHFQTKVI